MLDNSLTVWNDFDDMWKRIDSMFNRSSKSLTRLEKGLQCINRPHNLYTWKDKDGNIVGNRLSVVTTPFKKDQVHVTIEDNILTVECGNDIDEVQKEGEIEIYHGISSQSYKFQLKLSDKIDLTKVEATNEDGILDIKLPFKPEEKEESKKITIL